jgi:hypothetical protein
MYSIGLWFLRIRETLTKGRLSVLTRDGWGLVTLFPFSVTPFR